MNRSMPTSLVITEGHLLISRPVTYLDDAHNSWHLQHYLIYHQQNPTKLIHIGLKNANTYRNEVGMSWLRTYKPQSTLTCHVMTWRSLYTRQYAKPVLQQEPSCNATHQPPIQRRSTGCKSLCDCISLSSLKCTLDMTWETQYPQPRAN